MSSSNNHKTSIPQQIYSEPSCDTYSRPPLSMHCGLYAWERCLKRHWLFWDLQKEEGREYVEGLPSCPLWFGSLLCFRLLSLSLRLLTFLTNGISKSDSNNLLQSPRYTNLPTLSISLIGDHLNVNLCDIMTQMRQSRSPLRTGVPNECKGVPMLVYPLGGSRKEIGGLMVFPL